MAEPSGKRSPRRIMSAIIELLLVALLAMILYYFVGNLKNDGTRLVMPFGFGCAVVLSGSMEPTLMVDDLVFVRESDSYSVGDIVIYHREGSSSLTIHRIISIDEDTGTVVTQGDANNTEDDPIRLEDIQGRMIGKVSNGTGFILLLRRIAVAALVILLAVFILCGVLRSKK